MHHYQPGASVGCGATAFACTTPAFVIPFLFVLELTLSGACDFVTHRYFKAVAMPTFKAKGWKVIDWTEISAALAFDMAVQADGLHVAGSPMKVAVNIMLNVLCEP